MSEAPAPYLPTAPPPIALMQCPIAGLQFHGGEACFHRIRVDDRLTLQREPGNRRDPRAITVQWQGVMLGYVPRDANYALSQMMDRGARAEARVKSLRAGGDPWQRVLIEVTVHAAASVGAPERPKEPEVHWIPACAGMTPAELTLARDAALTPKQRETGLAVLRDCFPDIAARLSRPVMGVLHEGRREVHLWDTITIEIAADGTGLVARSTSNPPALTVDLKRPLSAEDWLSCFVGPIATVCSRHGLTKANMSEALQRWICGSLQLTFEGLVDFEALRKAALDFLAPEPLARSLTNRIFGRLDSRLRGNDDGGLRGNDDVSPSAEAFSWVCGRATALALCAIEQPAMLPFLRLVQDDKTMKAASDPLAALRERLLAEGLEPAAWKKLARRGFGAFERMGEACWKPIPIARFANLLHRLDVQAPPADFVRVALRAALGNEVGPRLNFERHPLWFMRALLREVERRDDAKVGAMPFAELDGCLDWLVDARPEPDANQQRAGWPWILEQAQAHRVAREAALAAPWDVPLAGMLWGPYRVVAIDCMAALTAEAQAMKNCLATYEEACREGYVAVYSIRERATGARVACFAVEAIGESWGLVEVAGKMNAAVDEEIERIAHALVVKLNGGRGGEVAPF